MRPSRCDPSLGEGYVLSMATRIQDGGPPQGRLGRVPRWSDASAIDQRIEALRAEIEKLSRSPPTDHRVRVTTRTRDGEDLKLKVVFGANQGGES